MADLTLNTSIVGVGTVGIGKFADSSSAELADIAVAAALEDAGMDRSEIDGLLVQVGSPRGIDYDSAAQLLAIDARFTSQTWSHGRYGSTVLQHGALALSAGMADAVLCLAVFRNSAFSKVGTAGFPSFAEGLRDGGGPHAETHWAGLAAPAGAAGLSLRRYLYQYGVDREKLNRVVIRQRQAASANPMAFLRTPVDENSYAESRYVVEPLRVLDCSVLVDTAVAVILTRNDRARDLRQVPVQFLACQGIRGGPEEFVFGQPGLGIGQASSFAYVPEPEVLSVFDRADRRPQDIDALYCYDGFSPQVLWTLERFGFCAPGEAADFLGPIGSQPGIQFNTSGGHLSEGHTNGWGQLLEIVRQMRGDAGDRQIDGYDTAMWGTTLGDAIIYGI